MFSLVTYAVAYAGGALTLLSPCILPVLPFVFARSGQPFWRVRLPMLLSMALMFAGVGLLASVGANWAIRANETGRVLAMLVLALSGLALLSPRAASLLARPAVALGNRLALTQTQGRAAGVVGSMLLGAATALLWTPCAGPILGLVLSAAAWQGPSIETAGLLLAFAAGAASALGLALHAGGRILRAFKLSLTGSQWLRRGLGVAVLAGVTSVALDAAANPFAAAGGATDRLENALLGAANARPGSIQLAAASANPPVAVPFRSRLPDEGALPNLQGAVTWLNSPPLTAAQLRGKVVLVDFWTYSCINCIRTLPYARAWYEKYKDQGLVVIGVHAPEFAFEKNIDNVKQALAEFHLNYPIAIDNDFRIWRSFSNSYWPAFYLADAQGRIRYRQFGEGEYNSTERAIQELLREAGSASVQSGAVQPQATGIQAAPALGSLGSDETYLGYRQASGFVTAGAQVSDAAHSYSAAPLHLNQWSLAGNWQINADDIASTQAGGAITYRFRARDLHLVLGPQQDGRPVRFQVTVDGQPPGVLHGADTDVQGNGVVTRTRLFQLVRQQDEVRERSFAIRFLDPGVHAYAFTFG